MRKPAPWPALSCLSRPGIVRHRDRPVPGPGCALPHVAAARPAWHADGVTSIQRPAPPGPDVAALRRDYLGAGLPADLPGDPLDLLRTWLADAIAAGLPEPNAMVLATATSDGWPSARLVLLKGIDEATADGPVGLVFYTNYRSRKAVELDANPRAALTFPWHWMHRQVRVEGMALRVGAPESAAYFRTRPRGSQLGAWASHQSAQIAGRAELEARYGEVQARWPEGTEVPAPGFWGGYRVVPEVVEFWAGRPNRLHDRVEFRRSGSPGGGWVVRRLAP